MWTIVETNETYKESTLRNSLSLKLNEGQEKFTEEQIADFIEKSRQLEEQKRDIETQFDMVINAKQNLEKLLNNERKVTNDL